MGFNNYDITMYYIECDNDSCQEDSTATEIAYEAKPDAEREGFKEIDGKWYCPDCLENWDG